MPPVNAIRAVNAHGFSATTVTRWSTESPPPSGQSRDAFSAFTIFTPSGRPSTRHCTSFAATVPTLNTPTSMSTGRPARSSSSARFVCERISSAGSAGFFAQNSTSFSGTSSPVFAFRTRNRLMGPCHLSRWLFHG